MVACLVAGLGIGSQRRAMGQLQEESEKLEKRIAQAHSTGSAGDSSRSDSQGGAPGKSKSESINWAETAAHILESRENGGGVGNIRMELKLRSRLAALSKEELVAALDEIAALDLSARDRRLVEISLFGPLAKADPELALTRFIGRDEEGSGQLSWQMGKAMTEWMAKDQNAAIAWLDRQVASGNLESKSLDQVNRVRTQIESEVFKKLILSDPAAAEQRLAAMPQGMRKTALMEFQMNDAKPETQQAYAAMVRNQVPQSEQARILAMSVGSMVDKDGFQKVDHYLDNIDASPAERAAAVESVLQAKSYRIIQGKKISVEDVDDMREWAAKNAPDSVSRATGTVIANSLQIGSSNKMTYAEAADLIDRYHDEDGGDEILIGFLENGTSDQDVERARTLAEKITDEKRRKEILNRYK